MGNIMKTETALLLANASATRVMDAPPYFNAATWNERMPSASGFVELTSCQKSGVAGVSCDVPNNQLFATGMNGDEDLGEDIQMKGEPFHFRQSMAQWNPLEVATPFADLPPCPVTTDQFSLTARDNHALVLMVPWTAPLPPDVNKSKLPPFLTTMRILRPEDLTRLLVISPRLMLSQLPLPTPDNNLSTSNLRMMPHQRSLPKRLPRKPVLPRVLLLTLKKPSPRLPFPNPLLLRKSVFWRPLLPDLTPLSMLNNNEKKITFKKKKKKKKKKS